MRTTLTSDELRLHGRSLRAQLAEKRGPWGLLGWSFRGSPDAVVVEVKIAGGRGRKLPRVPTLHLPGASGRHLRLRVAIASHHPRLALVGPFSFGDTPFEPVTHPLAPGAPIFVGSGRARQMGGIAAVLLLDGKLHLLTCGHLFDGRSDVFNRATGACIARVSRNYLPTASPIDAAVCELTSEGTALLARSTGAPTWFRAWHRPDPRDSGRTAVFWPTHGERGQPFEVPINAVDSSTSVLFSRGPRDGFIELGFGAIPGDSGSLLATDDLYFGLCSGQVQGNWSYFTPFAAALDRLSGDYQEVTLWHPDLGIPG